MELLDGTYRLVGGDGGGLCVTVRSGKISPMDDSGPVRGVIRVVDRTFVVNRWDEPLVVNEGGTLTHAGQNYRFTLQPE